MADELHDAIEGAVLVGHNVRRFDMGMVEAEFMRLGRLPPKPKAVLDTLEAARRLKVGRPHNLAPSASVTASSWKRPTRRARTPRPR